MSVTCHLVDIFDGERWFTVELDCVPHRDEVIEVHGKAPDSEALDADSSFRFRVDSVLYRYHSTQKKMGKPIVYVYRWGGQR